MSSTLQEAILSQLKLDDIALDKRVDPNEGYLRSLLKDLEDTFGIAKKTHGQLVAADKPNAATKRYLESETYSEIREIYHTLWSKIDARLPKPPPPSLEETFNQTLGMGHLNMENSERIKIARLDIPKFNGSYDDWKTFYNLFTSAIHEDKKIKPVQKLQYLLAHLTGPARDLVKLYAIEEQNYELVLQALKEEYDHKRILANKQLSILFKLPILKNENSTGIKNLLNITRQCLASLKCLGLEIEKWDCILIYIIESKLPKVTQKDWENQLGSRTDIPTFSEFREFLKGRCRSTEAIEMSHDSGLINQINTSDSKLKTLLSKTEFKPGPRCTLCKGTHFLSRCFKFLKMNEKAKINLVTKNKLCTNCFSEYHTEQKCTSQRTCNNCKERHHTLLHRYFISRNQNNTASNNIVASIQSNLNDPVADCSRTFHVSSNNIKITLMGTAQIHLFNKHGKRIIIRALIDPCSDESYITESTLKLLDIDKYYNPTSVSVIGDTSVSTCTHRSDIQIGSMYTEFRTFLSAVVVKTITSNLPSESASSDDLTFIDGLPLADPSFDYPGKIHMLLGADIASDIELAGFRKFKRLSARDSKFGWIVRGVIDGDFNARRPKISFLTTSRNSDPINFDLTKFWQREEVDVKIPLKPDDELCERLFQSSVTRLADGRYCVDLPFKEGIDPILGSSKEIALRRFMNLEKKLELNSELKTEYHNTITEYLTSGHMIPVTSLEQANVQGYILPHHAVVKLSSSTTKVRVVFDASCKSSDGTSLNDHLLAGPKLQVDIRDILFLWRRYKFVITADIARMYRQFWISKRHFPYQKILWRFSSDESIQEYYLTTVTFGTSPAPYLAIRLLLHLSNSEEAKSLPLAANICRTEFYVDDLLSGAFDKDTAVEKQKQIRALLSSAGLKIRKWCSNSHDILVDIPEEDKEPFMTDHQFEEDEYHKTLGIYWSPESDYLSFICLDFQTTELFTKRKVLSLIAKLFDPLGFLSPCVMFAKILMKEIWKSNCEWDEIIHSDIRDLFATFLEQLPNLKQINLPRWIGTTDDSSRIKIYGFCDASTLGYGAVVYLLNPDPVSEKKFILLASKTKLAPTKFTSVARLELCGAVLLTELLEWITRLFKQELEIKAYSDSKIVLSWINSHPSRWKVFVANRTTQILDFLPAEHWFYIDTKSNPADFASRGQLPNELINNSLWWNGPDKDIISTSDISDLNDIQLELFNSELKNDKICLHTVYQSNELLEKFSSHLKLCRIVRLCSQFILNCLEKIHNKIGDKFSKIKERLSCPESVVFRCLQNLYFSTEINNLDNKQPLNKNSKLISLNPFVDGKGILRVGGRLENSTCLSDSEKTPIILPSKHQIITNLISEAHLNTQHGGKKEVMAYLRRKFCILKCSNGVKFFIQHCMPCFRYAKKHTEELMGNLPAPRVNISRPFIHSGVDFAGPIKVKVWRGRIKSFYKSYVALFICLSTKAVHIELVSDLSSEGFLASFKRFSSRRGRIHHMYSDQGTNFIGASKLIDKECSDALKAFSEDLHDYLADRGTIWHFIPPAAPNFGGLWEAGVKSVKHHLYRVVKDVILSFEELNTLLIQIEGTLNSRPLCPMNDNPDDFCALTPSHFLIGEAIVCPLEPSIDDLKKITINKWQFVQRLFHNFWNLWVKDYLHLLQRRHKWRYENTRPYQNGDLVLITDERFPPSTWPLARILATHPGKDGLIRVVTLKKPGGRISKRAISKIRLLPIYDKDEPITDL